MRDKVSSSETAWQDEELDAPIYLAKSVRLSFPARVDGGLGVTMGSAPGFIDFDDRLRRLSDLGDQLDTRKNLAICRVS